MRLEVNNIDEALSQCESMIGDLFSATFAHEIHLDGKIFHNPYPNRMDKKRKIILDITREKK